LRNIALVPADSSAEVCSTGFTVLRPNGAVIPEFLFRYVLTNEFIDGVTPQQTGTHYPATSDRVVMGQTIPLPPLSEQRRIVAKLERLLGKVADCQARLEKIPKLLGRFRQSVLAAAFQGDYPKNSVKNLLAESLCNGHSVNTSSSGFPVLRLTCLKDGKIDLSERKTGDWSREDAKKYFVRKGDFYISRGSGSRSHVGRGGLLAEQPDEVAFPDTLIRLRANPDLIVPTFLSLIWNSSILREQIEGAAHTTAGIWKISQKDIEGFMIPTPPLEKQKEIVSRVEALFRYADQLEERYRVAKVNIDKLTQSVLAKAFRGELTPQDPNDEPASVLLERIRAERDAQSPAPKQKRGPGAKKKPDPPADPKRPPKQVPLF
jgi:type I restriction enzyme S subunit